MSRVWTDRSGEVHTNGSTLLERTEGPHHYRASCPACDGSWVVGYGTWRDREAPVCTSCSTRYARPDRSGERKGGAVLVERLPDAAGRSPYYRARCECGGEWNLRLASWQARDTPRCRPCASRRAAIAGHGRPRKPRARAPQPKQVKTFQPGETVGDWTLSGEHRRDESARQRRWQCTCSCGREVWVLGASLRNGKSTCCGRCGLDQSLPVGYGGAHQRIVRAKGRATYHPCIVCAEPGNDWAYTHSDLFALVAAERKDGPKMQYSTDPDRYESMCREHHRAYDARVAAMIAGKVKVETVADLFAALMGKLPALDLTPDE